MRYKHKCKRCGGEWESIPERPVQCRLCGSALWDRERVRKLGGGRPKEVQAEGTRRIVGTGAEYDPAEEDQSEREETVKIRVTKPVAQDVEIRERQLVTEEDGVEFSQDRKRKGKSASPINKVVKNKEREDLF